MSNFKNPDNNSSTNMRLADVIRIDTLENKKNFPEYVAIFSEEMPTNVHLLSPKVMQWSGQILLCRLSDCGAFWQSQAEHVGMQTQRLLEKMVQQHFGMECIAVFGQHPWQCLVFLNYLIMQYRQGCHFLQNRLNRNIYKNLDWQPWFLLLEPLSNHLAKYEHKKFKAEAFRRQIGKLQRFISRLGILNPYDLSQAQDQSITRRFDQWLGNVWRWHFTNLADLDGFPWIEFNQTPLIIQKRELEYPINQWDAIAELLKEDLTDLCHQFDANPYWHINRLQWSVRLFNEQVIDIDISFRKPYSIHQDAPEFDTALYQARYVYDDLIRRLCDRDTDLDLPETMPFIDWTISVNDQIELSPEIMDLFASELSQCDYNKIERLENKLPVAIESYHIASSFFPESSFLDKHSQSIVSTHKDWINDDYLTQWTLSSNQRPLFFLDNVVPIDEPGDCSKKYLERCSHQWWVEEEPQNDCRDYFQLKNQSGRLSWAYCDFQGNWFKHGDYC